jgi:hypothetical protein
MDSSLYIGGSSSDGGGDDENNDAALFSWDPRGRFLPETTTTTLVKTATAVTANVQPIYNEEHDALFPLTWPSDYIGLVLAVLGLMVAAGGGIGGGGILVPIYILVLGFSPKHAIPLSNITVFGGALAKYVFLRYITIYFYIVSYHRSVLQDFFYGCCCNF